MLPPQRAPVLKQSLAEKGGYYLFVALVILLLLEWAGTVGVLSLSMLPPKGAPVLKHSFAGKGEYHVCVALISLLSLTGWAQ